MSSRIVVFGAEGFLGRSLTSALARQPGCDLVAVGRRRSRRIVDGVQQEAVERVPGDTASLIAGAGTVVWAAGCSTPGSTADEPLKELDDNLRPLLELLQAPGCADAYLLYISSGGTVYGDLGSGAGSETLLASPKSFYAAAKLSAELFIQAARHRDGGGALIVRPSNIYGPGQPLRPGFGIIPTAFEAARSGATLQVWGDGDETRDYLYIDDFLDLCLRAIDRRLDGTAVVNAGSGIGIQLNVLLGKIERICGHELRRTHLARRSVDVSRIVLDNALARSMYHWEPRMDIDEGLSQSWRWYISNRR